MKKLILAMLVSVCMVGCNNSAEGDRSRDTLNPDVNTGTIIDTAGDTSSYERMPNKITDSIPQ
jgi:uncharacterized lipoprotein NlpE involved in copper resistance